MLQGDRVPNSTDSEAEVDNNRNHGRRIGGPWVFGLKKGSDCRYFYVQRRDRATLQPIIQSEVAEGSIMHSDEWPAYGNLNQLNFRHFTVNHQQCYVSTSYNFILEFHSKTCYSLYNSNYSRLLCIYLPLIFLVQIDSSMLQKMVVMYSKPHCR